MTTEFLEAIWKPQGQGFAELRAFGDGYDVKQAWYPFPDGLDDFIAEAQLWNGTYNIFAGVLLRDKQGGTAEDCKPETPVLWADFDTKVTSRLHVFHEINKIEVPPQIIIDSGHGFHTYWLLHEKVGVREAQDVMKNLAIRHGGDIVGDPSRIMRVPGTLNIKTEPHKAVRMVKFNPFERVRFGDFINYEPVAAEPMEVDGYKAITPSDWIDRRLQESPWKGTRSEFIFGIICSMVRAKWSLEQAYEALIEAPAGEKIRELSMESGFRWTKTSYNKAMEAIALEQ